MMTHILSEVGNVGDGAQANFVVWVLIRGEMKIAKFFKI